jgi:hypothetical protein
MIGRNRDLELGADAVRRGNENRILKTGGLRVEKSAKAAKRGVRARSCRRARQGLDAVDQPVACVDIDPCIAIGEAGFGGIASYGFLAC